MHWTGTRGPQDTTFPSLGGNPEHGPEAVTIMPPRRVQKKQFSRPARPVTRKNPLPYKQTPEMPPGPAAEGGQGKSLRLPRHRTLAERISSGKPALTGIFAYGT